MKIFKVDASGYTYDEYDSVVIVAASKEIALDIAIKGRDSYQFWFEESQYPLTVKEVDLTTEGMILASYNAG